MKMFLTRLGFNSKMIITGDVTQIDLPDARRSGLIDAMNVLYDVEDIAIVNFTERDVVRHRLVQEIVRAYEKTKTKAGKQIMAKLRYILKIIKVEKIPVGIRLLIRKCCQAVLVKRNLKTLR